MREHEHEKRLIKMMRLEGFFVHHMDTNTPGFPDIFALKNGHIILIEVKDAARRGMALETSQKPFHYNLVSHGYHGLYVVKLDNGKGIVYQAVYGAAGTEYIERMLGDYRAVVMFFDFVCDGGVQL